MFIPHQSVIARGHRERWIAVIARLLLVVFAGMLLVPLLPASTLEAGLALCCKRSGKHLCAAPGGARFRIGRPGGTGISERCPYPIRQSLPATVTTLGLAPLAHAQASACRNVTDRVDIASPFSASFPDANLKRGPPARPVNLFA